MMADSKRSFNLLLSISMKAFSILISLVVSAAVSPFRDEHSLEQHPAGNVLLPFSMLLAQEYGHIHFLL
uniref:Uncharacterized protein n=1 Tax=Gossypium raimondii TaxID=29730 RepID=A0A0D2REF5_GOSRA|nr:hypothetical protein B456_008G128600 [Gossypium raimondii]